MRPMTDLLFTQSSEDAINAASLKNYEQAKKIFDIGNGVNTIQFDPSVAYHPR